MDKTQKNLVDDVDDDPNVTPEINKLAEARKKTSIAKAKASAKYKEANQALLEAMGEAGIERIKINIDGNWKWLYRTSKDEIKELSPEQMRTKLEGGE